MMRLGIFGGTFDPPHIGHLILAAESIDQLNLDRVLWVLTLNPPHKAGQAITNLDHRLDMVEAAINDDPHFKLSRIDIDRPPPHYAFDTVILLGDKYPGAKLIYLMGGDSLDNLPLWYKPLEFVNHCHRIGVMRRLESNHDLKKLEALIPGLMDKIQFIETPLIDISATDIRDRIRQERTYRYYLPSKVYELITQRNLYKNDAG